jgi:hypothetical protein
MPVTSPARWQVTHDTDRIDRTFPSNVGTATNESSPAIVTDNGLLSPRELDVSNLSVTAPLVGVNISSGFDVVSPDRLAVPDVESILQE